MIDKIEQLGQSLIQHGVANNRIYLMKLAAQDFPGIITKMDQLAHTQGYSKIIAKIPTSLKASFLNTGYLIEGCVKNFFQGKEDCYFLAKYLQNERREIANKAEILRVLKLSQSRATPLQAPKLAEDFQIKPLGPEHLDSMLKIYKKVFASYPFPIFDLDYIAQTMTENVNYYGVFKNNKIIAVSSSEIDFKNLNTEMTDFATLPGYRGQKLAYHLLKKMENDARHLGIKTAYTIARSKNAGMNITFAKNFYQFGGVLPNNTNICANIETMNIWYKTLS